MALSKIQDIGNQVIPNLGRRNLAINGAIQIAQRGTSATSVTSAGADYLVDRINYNLSSAGTWSFSQDSDAPSGFTKSFKALCTNATGTLGAGGYLVLYQNFEGQDFQQLDYGSSSAKTVTLSFYVKSNKTGTYQVSFRATDGATERHIGGTYTVNSSGVWERKTITYVGDTAQAIINNNTRGNTLEWWLVAGTTFTSGSSPTAWQNQVSADRAGGHNVNLGDATNNYWQVTGIQLEVGDTVTDFEHRSFAEELALCQRYHCQVDGVGTDYGTVGSGQMYQSTTYLGAFQLPVAMRAKPSFALSVALSNSNFSVVNGASVRPISSLTITGDNQYLRINAVTTTSGTAGQGAYIQIQGGVSALFSSEL